MSENVSSSTEALPTAFFELFLDSGLNHSSGYFDSPSTTLDEAQLGKIDSVLSRCNLQRGMLLLDVGCGWGGALRRAAKVHRVSGIGLTVEREQYQVGGRLNVAKGCEPSVEIRLQRWEDFSEPVDRIICINAFENFSNKERFFAHCRGLLPRSGVLVLLTVTAERPLFRVISKGRIFELASSAGFAVQCSESLAEHYARTLDRFVDNLTRSRREAEAIVSAERVDRSILFYKNCAGYLRSGVNDMFEFRMIAT